MESDDLKCVGDNHTLFESFELSRRNDLLSMAQSLVSSRDHSAFFLHYSLTLALSIGDVETACYILSAGALIVRQTPTSILSAPSDRQILLFGLLSHYGWTANTPGYYSAVLLPQLVTNSLLLGWFLGQGANPNLNAQRDHRDRYGEPDTNLCEALESAAGSGNVKAVRMLLNAGAEIANSVSLHFAAGVCPNGMNPHAGCVTPSKKFDISRIPVMALLVERGADVNQVEESQHMVPRYAIVYAVMAGAVKRVKWLLKEGADPKAKGACESAMECARTAGNEEMKRAMNQWINVREASFT